MKKLLSATALALAIVAFTPFIQAHAAWYVFGDAVYAGINYQNGAASFAPSALWGVNAGVGYDIIPNVSVEVGGLGMWGSKSPITVQAEGATADAYVRLPLDSPDVTQSTFNLFATAGVAYIDDKISASGGFSNTSATWDFRGGGGLEIQFTPQVLLRTTVRYQQTGFSAFTNGSVQVDEGLVWRFNGL